MEEGRTKSQAMRRATPPIDLSEFDPAELLGGENEFRKPRPSEDFDPAELLEACRAPRSAQARQMAALCDEPLPEEEA